MRSQGFDPLDPAHAPQLPDLLLGYPVGNHVEVDTLRAFDAPHIDQEFYIREVVFQAADVVVPQAGLLECVDFVIIVQGQGAVEGGWAKVGVEEAGMVSA